MMMWNMTNEECITMFLDWLSYVPYIKDKKSKVQRFINGTPLASKDQIEYEGPWSLEEVIKKLKHCYEKSK